MLADLTTAARARGRFENPCADTFQMKGVRATHGGYAGLFSNRLVADWALLLHWVYGTVNLAQ